MDENGHEIAFGWDRFGLSSRLTAAGQLTSATRGADGLVAEVTASVTGRVDRTVRREHDAHGRVTRVAYAKGEVETFAYDRWGRLSARTRGSLKETYRYDHFGRLVEKDENGTVFSYAYDAWGRRTSRTVRFADGGEALEERRAYDKYGRLVEIAAFGTSVKWRYDDRGRVARQVVDGSPIDFAYTKDGRLAGKWLGGRESPDASVEYEYSRDGRIAARTANGVRQAFAYDARGQLVAVRENGADVERYAYDPAGNMVRKTVRGKTTTFTFDGANQLVSSTTDGVTTRYAYDAAGRLVREGNRTYRYGYLDKVLSVTDGKRSYTYAYHVDGQLARADYGDGRAEGFAWDGLALVRRGDESFVNEPHVGGGNPVVSSRGAAYFNDLLGTTVGVREGRGASWKKSARRYTAAALTAFGESVPVAAASHNSNIRQFDHSIISSPFFTGKPQVEGLGYAFLYRNYRADLAKWQTADPLGYPDGWNQLAYCGNRVLLCYDLKGAKVGDIYPSADEAAIDWAKEYNDKSISDNKEYGSIIYENGGGYSYTDPVIGGEHSVNPFENGIPGPYEGYIHSHGDKSPGYNDEDFSKADSTIVNTYGKPGYLVTPSGVLKKKPPFSPPRDNKAKYKRMTMNSLNKAMLLLTLIGGCCNRTSFVVDEDAMYFDDGQEVLSVSQAKSCVVTEQKAAHVAEQLFIETFGNKVMGERPWRVTNRGEYFLVTGTLPHPLSLGGVAQMKIRKADGRVWVYYHGK